MVQSTTTTSGHVWRFFRTGGTEQVRLETGEDLAHLDELDPKLWAALSCPTRGLEFDAATLDLIDTDQDGRIRVPEIQAAVRWACANLKVPGDLARGSDALPLSAINETTPDGAQLLAVAKRVLESRGKANAPAITVNDTSEADEAFRQSPLNGDGVVPADSTQEPVLQQLISDIITGGGAVTDRSGKAGVSQATAESFFAAAQAYSDWWHQAEQQGADIFPLGEATGAGFTLLQSVKPKVDDYFARNRLAAFDPLAVAALNYPEGESLRLAVRERELTTQAIATFPLAQAEAGRPLPLTAGINPAWAEALQELHAAVVTPLVGPDRTSLTETEWAALNAKFVPYASWLAAKPGGTMESLGLTRIREILAGDFRPQLAALIEQDQAEDFKLQGLIAVERLVRYYRDLYRLLHNFVNFADFYDPSRRAVFQVGTLYLDGRSCELCLRADRPAAHAALAALSKTYLLYCDCARRGSTDKMTIAAAVTAGEADNLMVGRNGVFYDRQGQDWDATVTRIVENPVSIRQAFWAPYEKFVRLIETQLAKRAEAPAASSAAVTQTAAALTAHPHSKGTSQAVGPRKWDLGTIALIGTAIGGVSALVGGSLQALFGLGVWMPVGMLGIILLISGPSMVIAWLKLRQRNLGPLLDANGWAINTRLKINLPFGRSLTSLAQLPPRSERAMYDPYAEKRGPVFWGIVALIIIVIAMLAYHWRTSTLRSESRHPLPTNEIFLPPAGLNNR